MHVEPDKRRPTAGTAEASRPAAWCALAVTALLAAYLAATAFAQPATRSALARSDVIVVLGGDGPTRAARAAGLWREGLAPRILVSGDGDCAFIRDAITARGVPRRAVETECRSRNTLENALYAAPLLTLAGVRTAILVTSWFHSPRAIATFESICPGIKWTAAPTAPPGSMLDAALGHYGPAIAKEYFKAPAYALRRLLMPPARPGPGEPCADTGGLP